MTKYYLSAEDRDFVEHYNPGDYDRPSVTADILIFTVDPAKGSLELLMIKRKNPPFRDYWALPGGFVNMDESLEEGARRELFEETGVKDVHLEQLYTFGDVGRDPRMRVITVAYFALVPKALLKPKAGDDAAETKWFTVSLDAEGCVRLDREYALPTGANVGLSGNAVKVAFDHTNVIRLAVERLQGKLNYSDIALSLLADKNRFSIYELQKIHEAILNRRLDPANFRRSFFLNYLDKDLVEDTGEDCREYSRRASHYYKLLK